MYGIPKRKQAANGGLIVGPGTGTSDSIEKEVPAGSYILPADTTKKLGYGLPGYNGKPKMPQKEQPRLGIPGYNKQVPVAVSNGEMELPPEQVHAVGAAVLDQVKDATHKPKGFGLNKEMLAAHKARQQEQPQYFFADGGLVGDDRKLKQTSFDITNTPAAQQATGIAGDPARADRMQAQFEQPVTGPRSGSVAPATGFGVSRSGRQPATEQPRLGIPRRGETAPADQPRLGLPGAAREAARQAGLLPAVDAPGDPSATGTEAPNAAEQQAGNGWTQAGNGIAMRMGADGTPEFTNDPSALTGAGAMPAGGMSRIGDGVGGGLSFGEPGDAQMAQERFGRANEIRSRALQQAGTGPRVTIIPDSSRTPTLADRQRARMEERQANTELMRQQARQEIATGAQQLTTEQLRQRQLAQDIQTQQQAYQRNQDLSARLARLSDPSLQGDARAQAEREYLMLADPKSFLEQQSKSGIDQVDLETKQLERDLLRQELELGGSGDGLKLTEQQSKDLGYYTRGNEANAQLARQGDALTSRATGERGQIRGLTDTLVRGTPWIGDSALANSLVSTERQQAEQAGREVLAAILRKDTGAAITQQEMEIYGRMYLPQPGDSDEVLNQKAEARTRALASIRGGLGTAERKAAPLLDGQRTNDAAPARISGDDDYGALPSGALFVAPDGSIRRKP